MKQRQMATKTAIVISSFHSYFRSSYHFNRHVSENVFHVEVKTKEISGIG